MFLWRVPAVVTGLMAASCGFREAPARPEVHHTLIANLSIPLPGGFVRKALEKSREPLLNIPGAFTDQVFASWEGPGGQSFYVFYWSDLPPRDLGPMHAAQQWKTTVAGQETEAARTDLFMGSKQEVLVTWLKEPRGAGRFLIYARNMPRETFDRILAALSFQGT
ncbi:MAG: hypothetical protein ACE15B_14350 [Bryobacteraceae bacterium]